MNIHFPGVNTGTITHADIVPLEHVNIPVCVKKGTPAKDVEFKLDQVVLYGSCRTYVTGESHITAEDSRDLSDSYKWGKKPVSGAAAMDFIFSMMAVNL